MLEAILSDIYPLTFNYLLIFGLLIVGGVIGGLLAVRLRWLPTITGFMLVGLVLGPSVTNILNSDMLLMARDFVEVSLGLILFRLGSSLSPREIVHSRKILASSAAEALLTFVVISAGLIAFDVSFPIALLTGAICISSSPAVIIHVASEVRASGPVTDTSQSLVALNNIISFLLFTTTLPFVLSYGDATWQDIVGIPLYRMLGAVAAGLLTAYVITRISFFLDHASGHFAFPLVIGGITIALGLSIALKVSFLFAALVLGLSTRVMEKESVPISKVHFGYAEDLFYIVLFVTSGANLHIDLLREVGFLAVAVAVMRCTAKFVGVTVCGKVFRIPIRQAVACSMLLVPMAGLAIGLVNTTSNFVPEIYNRVSVIIFAAVAVLETVGPPIAKAAFRIAGEEGRAEHRFLYQREG